MDLSKLSRDYMVEPLKRGEYIPKQDLQYLLVEQNLTLKEISKIIGRSTLNISKQCKLLGIKKQRIKVEKTKKNVDNIFLLIKEKYEDAVKDYNEIWDYYIPEIDLYILNFISEKHQNEPFDSNNHEHWRIVKEWATEATASTNSINEKNYYTELINNWTVLDVLKRNTAKDSGLNYVIFNNEDDFLKWYEN